MVQAGRKRLDEDMVRIKLPSRLPKWMVDKLTEMGGLTEHLEKAVILYLKTNGKLGK